MDLLYGDRWSRGVERDVRVVRKLEVSGYETRRKRGEEKIARRHRYQVVVRREHRGLVLRQGEVALGREYAVVVRPHNRRGGRGQDCRSRVWRYGGALPDRLSGQHEVALRHH